MCKSPTMVVYDFSLGNIIDIALKEFLSNDECFIRFYSWRL